MVKCNCIFKVGVESLPKSVDSTQVERQWKILTILSWEKNWLSISDICEKLEVQFGEKVNRRTVQRDIDALSLVFPISEQQGSKGTVYALDSLKMDNIMMSFNELVSLYFLRENLKNHRDELGKTAYQLIDKIIKYLPAVYQDFIERLYRGFMVESNKKSDQVSMDVIDTLYKAISEKKTVRMKYYSFSSDKVTYREVDPYIIYYKDGYYYLAGFCRVHNDIRDFRVSRIMDVAILDKSFVVSKDFDRNKYNKYAWNILKGGGLATVKVLFKGNAARLVKEYERHRADSIVENEDGSVVFEKKVSSYEEIMRWILGYGSEAVVIEPRELACSIVEEINAMKEAYAKQGLSETDLNLYKE